MTDPFEIAGKIHELIKKKHLDYDFCVLAYYNQYKGSACIGTRADIEIQNVCIQHLVDVIQCPTHYPYRTIADLQVYSAIWKEGIIVLAGISFDPRNILDETVKQLGIGVDGYKRRISRLFSFLLKNIYQHIYSYHIRR